MKSIRLALGLAFVVMGSSAALAETCRESYEALAEPIVARKCIACHSNANSQAGLSLQRGSGYDLLVSVASTELPEMARVAPGDSAMSYLAHKLQGTHTDVGGSGMRMPPAGLPAGEIETILAWIDGCEAEETAG